MKPLLTPYGHSTATFAAAGSLAVFRGRGKAQAATSGAGRRERRLFGFIGRAWRWGGPEFHAWKGEAYLFALAILSALLMRLPFPRLDLTPVAALGLAPFLWALPRARSGKQAFYLGWVFGAVYYYVQLFWLNILTQYFMPFPIALIALGVYLGLFKALFAWLVWRAAAGSRWNFLLAAAAWVSCEYLQSLGDMGFPWGYLGHTLWPYPALVQLAAWTGVYGLSLGVFWCNHLVADGFRVLRREAGAPATGELFLRIATLAVFVGVMAAANASAKYEESTGPATIGIVQPNIPQKLKVQSYSFELPENEQRRLQNEILFKTIRLSHALQNTSPTERCDLLLWPETAVTDNYFSLKLAYRTIFDDLATTRLKTAIFFGADHLRVFRDGQLLRPEQIDPIDYEANPADYKMVPHVAGWFAEPGRGISRRVYHKMQLVPFAEGLPFIQHIKPLADFLSNVAGMVPYTPGTEHLVYDLKAPDGRSSLFRFGPMICYESCYPPLSRALVRNGAELLVVITNDAWYETTAGPRFHLLESVFRAVETRRWIARCANHGISCFISPRGEIVEESELARDAILKRRVGGVKTLTFYSRFGDLFAWVMLFATVVLLVSGRLKR